MDAASAGYPSGFAVHSQREFGSSPRKVGCSSFEFPLNVDVSRIRLCPSSTSSAASKMQGLIDRICALPNIDDFYWEKSPTPILDAVENPLCLKNLTLKELKQLADEIRLELSSVISDAQISSKASLAVVDLTVAIHHVFHAPVDKILWDVGDQTYAHKILTGRRSLMKTVMDATVFLQHLKMYLDWYEIQLSAMNLATSGMAVARDIKGRRERIVAVISNWTIMAGQVYEAMGNAGYLDSNMVVILNDSHHSLHPKVEEGTKTSVNALSSTLSRIQSSKSFRKLREVAKGVTKRIGGGMHELAAKVDEYARGMMGPLGSTLFEELGLYYIGPVDGHNIEELICVLEEVASLDSMGPVLIHVITDENQGAEYNQKSDMVDRQQDDGSVDFDSLHQTNQPRTYSDCLVETLVMEAEKDKDIVVIHAGIMMEPSFQLFREKLPDNFFDVGMAEQHAVTFASGLACGGLKPFCIIPSSFLQRAYDQVIHDVDQQKIPVRFIITSAGLVGSDGPLHCGAFDITFMSCLPNMIVMAPSDEVELMHMVATARNVNDRPICFRYPRGAIVGNNYAVCNGTPIEIGKGRVLVKGTEIALLGYGSMVQNCLKAHALLAKLGIEVTVADARFCKPLDINLLRQLCQHHSFLITVEEGSIGGFGSHVAQFIALDGQLDGRVKWRPIVLPDSYIEHASPNEQLDQAGLTGHHIAATALSLLGRTREALLFMCS
ncbi:putative 1-deoxy-D-xylulose-5-phosphate synthase, chloroplastic [Senna tora]|uniref:1-deoxy-D-xylulose-5-phosphate synthase n=1 Tax=Senna tora TaxID=362788 RepID=A0A834T8I1_9FABA|nr:putative 1-deoxy-D-xylulose-5-phosphate synthase, chloroplastic [Senna tora]